VGEEAFVPVEEEQEEEEEEEEEDEEEEEEEKKNKLISLQEEMHKEKSLQTIADGNVKRGMCNTLLWGQQRA